MRGDFRPEACRSGSGTAVGSLQPTLLPSVQSFVSRRPESSIAGAYVRVETLENEIRFPGLVMAKRF